MIRNLLAICAFAAGLATFASAMAATYFLFRAIANTSASGPRRWIVKMTRLNAVLFPDELSPIGLHYRASWVRASTALWCSIVIMLAMVLGLELTKPN
jgi:hypothetical protein